MGLRQLLRVGIVKATSQAMSVHFQRHIAMVWDHIQPLLDDDCQLQVRVGQADESLTQKESASLRVVRGCSIDTLMQTDPNKTAIIWIMSDASSSQNMKLRCKKMDALPTDMGVLLPVDCALVEIITDEGTEVSAPALRMQDPVSLYETVVTATPRACIEGDINQNHWIRQVIPKETIKVIDCQSGLSQDKVREAFQGLAVLLLLTVPLPLVGMVAEEFEDDLPSGVRIMKLRTRRLSVLPQSDGQDDLSTMSLETYFHKNITGALYQVPSVRAVKQKLDRLSKGSVVSSKLIEALQQLVLECQQVSNTASLFDHNRKAANTTAGAIQRVLDNLVAADTCQICCNPVGGNNPLMMLGCCGSGLCGTCLQQVAQKFGTCPNCRADLDEGGIIQPVHADEEVAQEEEEDPACSDQDVVDRVEGLVLKMQEQPGRFTENLKQIYWSVRVYATRIIIFCASGALQCTEDYVNRILGRDQRCPQGKVAHHLSGRVQDKTVMNQYQNYKMYDYPMVLVLDNSASGSTVSGLDLPNTHLMICLRNLSNANQLLARVNRPQGFNCGKDVPMIILQ